MDSSRKSLSDPRFQRVFFSYVHLKGRKTRYTHTGSIVEFINKVGASAANYHGRGASPELMREGAPC